MAKPPSISCTALINTGFKGTLLFEIKMLPKLPDRFETIRIPKPSQLNSTLKNPPNRPNAIIPIPDKPVTMANDLRFVRGSFLNHLAKSAINKGPEPTTRAVTEAGTMLMPT